MSIIFIDFQKNLRESKGNNKNPFFCYSLEDQYQSLQTRIPIHKIRTDSLRDFIEQCFPTGLAKKYYISCSNFKREKITDQYGNQFLLNVILRPEITPQMKQYLPDKTNIILIGDIQEKEKIKSFVVKGIEFIDEFITSTNDIQIIDSFCTHTFGTSLSAYGKPFTQWTMDRPNFEFTIFTPDFIARLIKTCYPMSQESLIHAAKMYEKWMEYIDFRQKYLDLQSLRNFKFSEAEFITAYSINKQTYNRNASQLEDDLLVKHEDFKKGDQILLKSPVLESEEINLIAVHIDFNRKDFLSKCIQDKRGHLSNPDEKNLRIFSRENVVLSRNQPNGDNYEKLLRDSFSLDERYKLIFQDIEPNCNLVIDKYNELIRQELSKITERYQILINQETIKRKQIEEIRLSVLYDEELKAFEEIFVEGVDEFVKFNKDPEINKKIDASISQKRYELERILANKIKKIDKKSEDYKNQIESSKKDINEELTQFIQSIDIKAFYVEKHIKDRKVFQDNLRNKSLKTIQDYEKSIRHEITTKYESALLIDQSKKKIELEDKRDNEILIKIDNETIKRFSIYFKVNFDDPDKISRTNLNSYSYIMYDNRAEKAKIKRQADALDNFINGNVKNPYLASYLFAPGELKKNYYDFTEWKWFLESLNDKQKEAVQKAVSSRGIFLLQGPPGTGKTQVIAEIVGHMVQEGKKVLVASETHKAIDNVFDRLPLLADIRPLRLIATRSNKVSNFGPESLVDNFYENIAKNMRKVIRTYHKFNEYREGFLENYQKQKLLNDRIIKNKTYIEKTELEIKKLGTSVDGLKKSKEKENIIIDSLLIEIDMLIRTRRHLERANLILDEDIDGKIISNYIQESVSLIQKESMFTMFSPSDTIKSILQIDIKTVYEETSAIMSSDFEMKNELEIAQIRQDFKKYKDEFDEWLPNTEEFVKPLQLRLKELKDTKTSGLHFDHLQISKFINPGFFNDPLHIRQKIEKYHEDLIVIRNSHFLTIDNKLGLLETNLANQRDKIDVIDSQMIKISEDIRALQEDNDYKSIQEDEAKLRREIARFIEEFNVAIDYRDYTEAIEKIHLAYLDLERNFNKREEENRKIIPIFKKISDYLMLDEVRETDHFEYTKPLFDKVNLFGITNTSRDNFNESSMTELEKYNLGSIDLKRQSIDVVIIDEVSKSSFLDLLIPILYGKTIILVGDHRQLPPMYEFRNLRNDDFEHIDENVLTKEKNDRLKQLYEESFFKILFEQVPIDYKVMLNKQYRSHEHIMQVYNCFYNNQLQLGSKTQNAEKEHHLSIISNNRQIINPKKHVYFVDCKKFESKETDSTSIYNSNEADVVVQLLKLINDSYKVHPNFKPEISRDKDERMSAGVICTYGDQAYVIKQKIKNSKIKLGMFNDKPDAKLVISTVDDFQGDERDIIILSMVRNPQNRAKSDPGFVTAYQRINVALSRARRLLIVVGNRSYLEDKGVIDLPDVNGQGNDLRNFYVYKEVIGAINRYGTIFDDEDLLGGGKL